MPLVIYSLRGGHTNTHIYTCIYIRMKVILRNQAYVAGVHLVYKINTMTSRCLPLLISVLAGRVNVRANRLLQGTQYLLQFLLLGVYQI